MWTLNLIPGIWTLELHYNEAGASFIQTTYELIKDEMPLTLFAADLHAFYEANMPVASYRTDSSQ